MPEKTFHTTTLLEAKDFDDRIRKVALDILARHPETPIACVGIHTGGVIFADRVHQILAESRGGLEQGSIDISLYRDDLDNLGTIPAIKSSDITFNVDGTHIILFDDVLFTGRTIRAALEVLMDYGRPARIELAVLIDRGNRELPIAADYTGETIPTTRDDHISVRFQEINDAEGVFLIREEQP